MLEMTFLCATASFLSCTGGGRTAHRVCSTRRRGDLYGDHREGHAEQGRSSSPLAEAPETFSVPRSVWARGQGLSASGRTARDRAPGPASSCARRTSAVGRGSGSSAKRTSREPGRPPRSRLPPADRSKTFPMSAA